MIAAEQIETALNLTGVTLYLSPDGVATITANEPVSAAPVTVREEWEYATEIRSDNPTFAALATSAGTDFGSIVKLAATL